MTAALAPFRTIWAHLSPRLRAGFWVVLALAVVNSLLEMVLVGLTAMFGSALLSPDRFLGRDQLLQWLGPTQPNLLVTAGLLTLAGLAVKAVFGLTRIYVEARYTSACYRRLAVEGFERLIARSYAWHIRQNSAVLVKTLQEDMHAVQLLVVLTLAVLADLLIIGVLVGAMVWRSGFLIILVFGSVGVLSQLLGKLAHRRLVKLAREEHEFTRQAAVTVSQSLHGVKDAKALGREEVLLQRFEDLRRTLESFRARGEVLRALPRHVMELLGFGGLVLVVARLTAGSADAVETVTILAVGFIRLLPAVNRLLTNLAAASTNLPSAQSALELLEGAAPPPLAHAEGPRVRSVELRDVSFAYDPQLPVLQNVSVRLEPGSRLGLVGHSGGGKSTLADLICGLLAPTGGEVLVNGDALRGSLLESHPRRVGYVLQSPFLLDGTVAENVAFSFRDVDRDRVWSCLHQAQLATTVEELEQGLDTPVGERGVRLSGGQAQRLAIARSLYHEPDLLILDEATSALDTVTEAAFLESVQQAPERLTVLIAHRLSTVRHCTQILVVRQGQVLASGTHEELMESSPYYRELHLASEG